MSEEADAAQYHSAMPSVNPYCASLLQTTERNYPEYFPQYGHSNTKSQYIKSV